MCEKKAIVTCRNESRQYSGGSRQCLKMAGGWGIGFTNFGSKFQDIMIPMYYCFFLSQDMADVYTILFFVQK